MPDEPIHVNERLTIPPDEIRFRFSRSGGPGGQNVNKTASQVELLFDVASSPSLSESQRTRLQKELSGHIDSDGVLHLVSQATPSQWQNRQDVLDRFSALLRRALRPRRKRVPTRPSRAAKERRLESKRRRSRRKALRGRVRRPDHE